MDAGTYVDPARGRVKLSTYSTQWLASHVGRATSVEVHERRIRLHITPGLGSRALSSIVRSDLQGFVVRLARDGSVSLADGVWTTLRMILRSARLDGLITRDPCEGVRVPAAAPRALTIPTVVQVHALAEHMARPSRSDQRPGYHALALTAAMTGLRQSELLGVTLDSLDLMRRRVIVRPDRGQRLRSGELAPPKTAAGARTVPLGDAAVRVLAEHLRKHPADREDGYGGLVFAMSHRVSSRHLREALADEGFAPGVGWHIFRHFYASALIHSGTSVKVVQARLGHATSKETLDTYGHLWPDTERVTADAIDAVFAEGTPRVSREA